LGRAPLPAKPEHPIYVASRYKRRGAWQLFAGWSVADGYAYGQIAERKRFVVSVSRWGHPGGQNGAERCVKGC
jgi:hypothetical protein